MAERAAGPLAGVKVVDCATLFAGPLVATLLGDYGADVLKVEHPAGEGMRTMGTTDDGQSLWWAFVSRNKRCMTLKLSSTEGAEIFRRIVRDADVLVENFRPGTLERWGIGPEHLLELNPRLVLLRVTGFGQSGPYKDRPGYGTLAEAMSGFAYVNGWPDKPPTLPPFALGDGVAALTGAFAAMMALHHRDRTSGTGQVIDLAVYEPLFWINGPQAALYDQLGQVPVRQGNSVPHTAPRNVYATRDGHWIALSAATTNVAERLTHIIGRPELLEEDWYVSHTGRAQHAEELDALIGAWMGRHTRDEVLAAFATGEGAVAPCYSIADIMEDPHYAARETVTAVGHPELGSVRMQNLIVGLQDSPGAVRHPGRALGADNATVFGELGIDAAEQAALRDAGVI